MTACLLCGASSVDAAGALKHEGCCPLFMRGPGPGGDPSEWPTLLDAIADRIEAGELISEKSMSDRDFLAPLLEESQ